MAGNEAIIKVVDRVSDEASLRWLSADMLAERGEDKEVHLVHLPCLDLKGLCLLGEVLDGLAADGKDDIVLDLEGVRVSAPGLLALMADRTRLQEMGVELRVYASMRFN